MVDLTEANGGVLLDDMRDARNADAVIKVGLLGLRASYPRGVILVFEGTEDKGVYFQWIRRARPEFSYEPFPCGGKKMVLALKKAVDRDRNDLKSGLYFIIDRDFDEYQGVEPDGSIFMTPRYSIENYLSCPSVLEEILKIDFGCDGKIALRGAVCELFEDARKCFNKVIRETNFLLYICRVNRIELPPIAKKFGGLLTVKLDGAARGDLSPLEYLGPSREPTEAEVNGAEGPFAAFDPNLRYRGKFLVAFFKKWLELLVIERNASRGVFEGHEFVGTVNTQVFTLENFASKSILPEGFVGFVNAMVH